MRMALLVAALALLAAAFLRHRPAARAVAEGDPNLFWSLGKADHSSDEFAPGAAKNVVYEIGRSSEERDWHKTQTPGSLYKIQFRAGQASAAVLKLDVFFEGVGPRGLELTMNGRRGFYRIQPAAGGPSLDERQANTILYSRQAFRIPLEVRPGENELGLSLPGDEGSLEYDWLALEKAAAPPAGLTATVEPTIFYKRSTELVDIVLHHTAPLGKAAVTLKVGGAVIGRESGEDGYDFGERVVEVEAPSLAGPAPYSLSVAAGGKTESFRGEFRPEKKWRIFAGLKIHNDIGYTDLQQHVQELDARNTDGVLDIMARFPFYKFNLETGWLVENYMSAREPGRVKQMLAAAVAGRLGVNAMYLNLMTGLCTGEEMYRSLYFSKGLERKHGVPFRFACLTDAPSHTAFVPVFLNDAGIKGFANGSNQTRAPLLQNSNLNEDSPFYWEGVNGRRVMTWFARSYLHLDRLLGQKRSVETLRRSVPQFLARYRRGDYPVDAVLLYGLYTDNADIREGEAQVLKEWNQTYAYPKITPATDADYYAYLEAHFAGKLPVFRGDAGSYWEDGAGSTAAETAMNRDSQRLLPVSEMAAALASAMQPAEVYPAAEFRTAWKNLLFYDEHTWGAYSSISQPDRKFATEQWDYKRAYAWRAHWAAKDLYFRSLNRLVQNISIEGPTLFVFNPDLWPRTDVVEVELNPNQELIDLRTGAPAVLDVVRERDNYRVVKLMAEGVPGLGYRAYGVRTQAAAAAAPEGAESRAWEAESKYYKIVFDRQSGGIAGLIDKELGRDLADHDAPYKLNELLYVSGGERSRILQDLATLRPAELEVTRQADAELVSNRATPFGRRVVIRAKARNVPEIETEVTLYDRLKRVDIVNRLKKQETRAKEAVYFAFPFRVTPPELAYQIQHAWVRPDADQLPGACRDWFTTQNVVVARDKGASIAWATPDAPLITLTDINRGRWMRRLGVKNGHVFSYAMNNYWFTNYKASQGGDFTFRYAITSGRSLGGRELARFDAETRSPLVAYDYFNTGNVRLKAAKKRMPAAEGAFFEIDGAGAQVTAFKAAEDGNGYILRLRETEGRKGTARLRSPVLRIAEAYLANGVEENKSPLAAKEGGWEIPLEAHEFTTVRLVLGAKKGPG